MRTTKHGVPTYEVVPVLVVELGGDGDDPSEEVGGEPQVVGRNLPLNVVLPQSVRPDDRSKDITIHSKE